MDHPRINRARANGVDANTLAGDLAGGGLGQPDDGMLRCDIRRHAGRRDEPRDRGGVDDRALLLLQHDRQHMAQAEKDAFDVHREHLIEHRLVILGGVLDGAFDAGIVEEAVDLAVGVERRFHIGLHFGGFGDVGLDKPRLAALLADDAGGRLAAVGVAIDDDDLGAALRKGERRGAADAVAGASDQRDLIGEIEIHRALPYFLPPICRVQAASAAIMSRMKPRAASSSKLPSASNLVCA